MLEINHEICLENYTNTRNLTKKNNNLRKMSRLARIGNPSVLRLRSHKKYCRNDKKLFGVRIYIGDVREGGREKQRSGKLLWEYE